MTTITLNDLLQTRLDEIAEDLWMNHRVLRVGHGNGRFIQIGQAATIEQWQCQADHGSGLCGEPLIPTTEVDLMLGSPAYPSVESPAHKPVEFEELHSAFGFLTSELIHWSDAVAAHKARD